MVLPPPMLSIDVIVGQMGCFMIRWEASTQEGIHMDTVNMFKIP